MYSLRLLDLLLRGGHEVHLVVTDYGRRLLFEEAGVKNITLADLLPGLAKDAGERRLVIHPNKDVGAVIASGFPRLDLVKLDIEGAEYEVFRTAAVTTLQAPRYWIVECHTSDGEAIDSVENTLTAVGFEVESIPKPLGQRLLVARRQEVTSHQT